MQNRHILLYIRQFISLFFPMSERKSEYQVRKEKLEQLRARGINPYVENFDKTHTIGDIIASYDAKTDLRDSEVIV